MPGCYVVFEYPRGCEFPHDIAFQIKDGVAEVPTEQSDLKAEIERTLDIIRGIFQPTDSKFRHYFDEMLALARYGLVSDSAQPAQALVTLRNLQKRFFDNEKGKVIGAHMYAIVRALSVGVTAIIVVAGIIVFAASLLGQLEKPLGILPYVVTAPGLVIGLLFSTFLRCRTVAFYDLHAIEADRFPPWMKTIFAFMTLLVVGAFLKAGLMEIKVGEVSLSNFDTDLLSAFVFGVVVGIGQEVVVSRIESIRDRIGTERGKPAA